MKKIMARINKPTRKPRTAYAMNSSERRELRIKAYNSKEWINARNLHLVQHPICEDCLKEGVVYAGGNDEKGRISVHHLDSPFMDNKINWEKLTDQDNLITLCSYHHGIRHAEERGYVGPEKIIEVLDALLLDDNWDEDTGDNN